MKKTLLINILTLLLISVVSLITASDLSAQVVADSMHIPANPLKQQFDSIESVADTIVEDLYYDDVLPQYQLADTLQAFNEDSLAAVYAQRLMEENRFDDYFTRFNPSPAKAVWLAALFPGAGQIYNRKYWKLPIVYGGFLALLYGYNFNQRYFRTYQNAYRDLITNSPNASYLQFLPGYNIEAKKQFAERNHDYLQKTFTRKKDTYRNWRDYCIVGMLGVYLVSIVDAYVDAALYHFDISPELDAYNSPSMMVTYKIDF